ncbi:MAG: peptide-methionine (R)-S-oxide reductase MsrB [Fimbriimonadaceae bacterium]|nr:peptide-methionine (R)-S-oxide reductase MsrB [Fimbriimonadaceae bacterium]
MSAIWPVVGTLAIGAAVAGLMARTTPTNPPMNETIKDAATGLMCQTTPPEREDKVILTDAEWKEKLTDEQYRILRNHGTEAAFCGPNLEPKGEGHYECVGCKLPLFGATKKFESGTGWPSYTEPYDQKNLWYRQDRSYGMTRVEVLCARCDGHLGHVFPDGPPPSGLRYCINGTVLNFIPKAD